MTEKKLTLKATGATQKQWGVLVLELNILKKAWKSYGVDIDLSGHGIKSIVEKGTRIYEFKNADEKTKKNELSG
jgi:hypothetical protein|tara:strand:+ start:1067 stop:1288 length:222 start_codon:yes stop_codon:yes gene_type:complete